MLFLKLSRLFFISRHSPAHFSLSCNSLPNKTMVVGLKNTKYLQINVDISISFGSHDKTQTTLTHHEQF